MNQQFDMALTWRLAVYSTVHTQFLADFSHTHHAVTASPLLIVFPWQSGSSPVLLMRDWLHRGNNHYGYELFGRFMSVLDEKIMLLNLMFQFFDETDAGLFRLCWGAAE